MYKCKYWVTIRNPFYRVSAEPSTFRSVPYLVRIRLTRGDYGIGLVGKPIHSHWIFELVFGRGAGYILGRTLYLARNIRNRFIDAEDNRPRIPLKIGFTQNANIIPCSDG